MVMRPRLPFGHADRHLECQEALEPVVIIALDVAQAAGWSRSEIAAAIIAVADNLMLADAANADLDIAIADMSADDHALPSDITRLLRSLLKKS